MNRRELKNFVDNKKIRGKLAIMKAGELFAKLYKEDEDFTKIKIDSFDFRLIMQKSIYLLEKNWLNLGSYSFNWYKYGPFSPKLNCDLMNNTFSTNDSPFQDRALDILRGLSQQRFRSETGEEPYDLKNWLELLGSLLFLKREIYQGEINNNEVILEKLIKEKPYLNKKKTNAYGLDLIKEMYCLD